MCCTACDWCWSSFQPLQLFAQTSNNRSLRAGAFWQLLQYVPVPLCTKTAPFGHHQWQNCSLSFFFKLLVNLDGWPPNWEFALVATIVTNPIQCTSRRTSWHCRSFIQGANLVHFSTIHQKLYQKWLLGSKIKFRREPLLVHIWEGGSHFGIKEPLLVQPFLEEVLTLRSIFGTLRGNWWHFLVLYPSPVYPLSVWCFGEVETSFFLGITEM